MAAIFFALGAAVVGFVGRMKAAPLVPAYAAKLRLVHDVLEPALRSQAKLARYLHKAVGMHGGIPRDQNAPSVELYENLSMTADSLEKLQARLEGSDFLDFSTAIQKAAEARLWLFTSIGLACGSAVCQVLILWSRC